MSVNIEELKRLAEAATPGPWSDYAGVLRECNNSGKPIATIYRAFNSQYIAAANPAAVLELIAEVDRLRDEVNGMTGTLARIETERNNQILRNHNLEIELRECRSIISRLAQEGQDAVEM